MSLCKCQQFLLLKIQKSFGCCVTERKLPFLFTAGAEMHLTTNVLCGSFVCEKAGLGGIIFLGGATFFYLCVVCGITINRIASIRVHFY
jgi:hypothetical protein